MSRKVTATELRKNIYRLIDEILETKIPLEIERKGRRLIIAPIEQASKLEGLEPHADCIHGDPEELVHLDWSQEWRPDI